MTPTPLILRIDKAPAAIACSTRSVMDGVPRQRFRKEVMRSGEYVHPKTGAEYNVTLAVLSNWAAQFSAMKAAGLKVNMPATHAGASDPDKNRGWVDDLFVEGDSLFMVCDCIGEDAILAAMRNDVSIFAEQSHTDSKGNVYAWPITHVALCPDPLIPGLGEFIPLAASRSGVSAMKNLPNLLAALGITDEVKADNHDALIDKAIGEIGKLKAPPADPLSASNSGKKADPMLVKTVGELRETKIAGLVAAAKITPAVADRLRKQFIGDGNAVIAASISVGDNGDMFDGVIASFAANDPLKLGEQSGGQTVEASNPVGSGAKRMPLRELADKREKAAAR